MAKYNGAMMRRQQAVLAAALHVGLGWLLCWQLLCHAALLSTVLAHAAQAATSQAAAVIQWLQGAPAGDACRCAELFECCWSAALAYGQHGFQG